MFRRSSSYLRVHPYDANKFGHFYHRTKEAIGNQKLSKITLPNSVASDQNTEGSFFQSIGSSSARQFQQKQEADRFSAEVQARMDVVHYNKQYDLKKVTQTIQEEGLHDTVRQRIQEEKTTFRKELQARPLDRNILEECYREQHGKRHERDLKIGHGWENWVARDEKNVAILGGSKRAQEAFGMGGTIHLEKSAAHPSDFPVMNLPEIALIGPTNAGKSSLINALLNAFVTEYGDLPGTTNKANFYSIGRKLMVVDFPGIGHQNTARRTELDKTNALRLLKGYLEDANPLKKKRNVRKIMLLFPEGLQSNTTLRLMKELQNRRMKFDVVITKTDKVPTKELARRVDYVRSVIASEFSCCKGIYMSSSLRLAGITKLQNVVAECALDSTGSAGDGSDILVGDRGLRGGKAGRRDRPDPGLELIDSIV